jgi:hypothetical protein
MMMIEVLQMFTTCLCNMQAHQSAKLPHKLNINRRKVISIFLMVQLSISVSVFVHLPIMRSTLRKKKIAVN